MENKLDGKKIMILCTTDNMITQFLIPHIEYMQKQGAIVECVCAKTGKWFDDIVAKGIVCHEIGFKRNPFKFANFKAYRKLVKLQKEKDYDIIYCQQPVGGMMGRLIGKKFKKKVFYTAHGFFFFNGCPLKNKLLYKNAEKFLAKYTDVLVTINDEDYEVAKTFKAKKVYKISGIGLPLDKFKQVEFDKDAFKKELGIEKDEKIVLTVAEMIKRKNYPTLLRAVANLKYEKFKYIICGCGVLDEKLKKLVKKLGIEDKVLFLGYRKDIPKIMQIADVFMLCSFMEGLTMAIMEAMNMGLPVLTSDARGNRDLIDDGKGGFVCPCEDVQMITEKLKLLLDNGVLRNEFGTYNKLKVKKFSLENVEKELEEIYNGNF